MSYWCDTTCSIRISCHYRTVPYILQVFAIEIVTVAVDFIPLAVEFGTFAVEFVGFSVEFVFNSSPLQWD